MTARLVSLVVTLFFIATVSVPVAVLNKLLFALIGLLAIVRVVSAPADARLRTWSPLIVLAVFLYGMLLGLGGHIDHGLARQLLFSVALLLLIHPVLWYGVDLDRVIKQTGIVLAALTFVFLGTMVASVVSPLAARAFAYFTTYSLSAAHDRDVFGAPVFMVRLGSSPFLLLPFALLLRDLRQQWRWGTALGFLLVVAAMVASTSRGLLLVAIAAAGVVLAERMTNTRRLTMLLVAVPLVVAGLGVLAVTTPVFSATDMSNAIKIGHAVSFVENLEWSKALIGEGLAALYYTSGLGRQVPQTEITLLDMLRYFGFLLAPLMFAALIFPSMRLRRYLSDPDRRQGVALFGLYLVLSLTNPVLFNSMGLSIVVWYWWRILRDDSPVESLADAPAEVPAEAPA